MAPGESTSDGNVDAVDRGDTYPDSQGDSRGVMVAPKVAWRHYDDPEGQERQKVERSLGLCEVDGKSAARVFHVRVPALVEDRWGCQFAHTTSVAGAGAA